jgi:hypothetical protein
VIGTKVANLASGGLRSRLVEVLKSKNSVFTAKNGKRTPTRLLLDHSNLRSYSSYMVPNPLSHVCSIGCRININHQMYTGLVGIATVIENTQALTVMELYMRVAPTHPY